MDHASKYAHVLPAAALGCAAPAGGVAASARWLLVASCCQRHFGTSLSRCSTVPRGRPTPPPPRVCCTPFVSFELLYPLVAVLTLQHTSYDVRVLACNPSYGASSWRLLWRECCLPSPSLSCCTFVAAVSGSGCCLRRCLPGAVALLSPLRFCLRRWQPEPGGDVAAVLLCCAAAAFLQLYPAAFVRYSHVACPAGGWTLQSL